MSNHHKNITDQGALNILRMFIDSLPDDTPGIDNANDAYLALAVHHADRKRAHSDEGSRL